MNISNRQAILFLLVSACLLIFYSVTSFSCKDKQTNNDIVFPDSLVSFHNQVEPLFQQSCVPCHKGSDAPGSLNLEANMWTVLIDHLPKIIIVNDGHDSPLVQHLDGRMSLMPPGHPLKANQINGVSKWIDEGAQPN